MRNYEDYSIELENDDIYYDSKGDVAVNFLDVNETLREEQLKKDIYHKIKMYQNQLQDFDTDGEKEQFIKSLFETDLRIQSFELTVDGENIEIGKVTYENI